MASTIQSGRRRKVELTVLVDKSGSDASQVVSVGATANVYLAGATVRSATGSPAVSTGQVIPISSPGMIEVGDVLQNGTASSPTFTVTAISRAQSGNKNVWSLTGTASASFAFAADDRLINTSRRPTIYKDPGDDISWGGSSTTSTAAGMVRFYTKARAVDVIVSGGTPSVTATVVRDVEASDTGAVLNVQDYGGSIKEALQAAAAMQPSANPPSIYVPAGAYIYDAADMDIDLDFPVRVYGDGPLSSRIFIEATAGNENLILFNVMSDFVTIEGLGLYGNSTSGTGEAIRLGDGVSAIGYCVLRNLFVVDWSSYALNIGLVSGSVEWGDLILIENCLFGGSETNAQVRIGNATTVTKFVGCRFRPGGSSNTSGAGVVGVKVYNTANVIFDTCDGIPATDGTILIDAIMDTPATGDQDGGEHLVISNCDFEGGGAYGGSANTPLVRIDGWSTVVIRDTLFYQFGSGVLLDTCRDARIENCSFKDISANAGAYKIKLTDCKNTLLISNHEETVDGSPNYGLRSNCSWEESGTTAGTITIQNGVVGLPRYTTANLPAGAAGKIITGSLAYDTTTNTMKVLRNDGTTWANVP